MPKLGRSRTWGDVVRVHRLQFPLPIMYLCYGLWGACYATGSARQLLTLPVLAAVIANVLLFVAGLVLNTVADVRSDERHSDKEYLATAVRRLSRGRTVRWAVSETAAGLALTAAIVVWTGRWLPAAAAIGIVVLHLLYNINPARLKHRGFVGAVAFGAASALVPSLLSYGAVRSDVELSVLLIFVGVGVLSMGRTAWWSVPDVTADALAGAGTPAVRHGPVRAAAMSCLVMLGGLGVLYSGLWWRYGPLWATIGIAAHGVVLAAAIAPLVQSTGRRALPSSAWMRTRAIPLVTAGEIVLVIVPLIGG